jgi:hypothetical protein
VPSKRRETEPQKPRRKPATTPEARELELISLANDLAEEQLRNGTASSQVMTNFLKLGSTRERLEQQRLEHENELTRVKIETMERAETTERLLTEALRAFKSYTGEVTPEDPHD